VFAALALVITTPVVALAHGGGLDSLGCHHNRQLGGYHCHRGSLAGQSFASKSEALRALEGSRPQAKPAPAPTTTPKLAPAQAPATITGRASIIDGDTLEIHGQRIRLHGIDAPESGQTCLADGERWRCGQKAAFALADFIGHSPVRCEEQGVDRYGRVIAACYVQGEDIERWMVLNGWALAYRRYSTDYVAEEQAAIEARRGLWRGEFIPPWEWRRGARLQAAAGDAAAGACLIKGNISKSGERIYHVPGGAYYDRTKIGTAKGERWFCSEAEAQAEGWRRSRR
jgi:endonuclease YncB( thermonuclease family)